MKENMTLDLGAPMHFRNARSSIVKVNLLVVKGGYLAPGEFFAKEGVVYNSLVDGCKSLRLSRRCSDMLARCNRLRNPRDRDSHYPPPLMRYARCTYNSVPQL